jgi:hypothetical protein
MVTLNHNVETEASAEPSARQIEHQRIISQFDRLIAGGLDRLNAEVELSVKLADALKEDFRESINRLVEGGLLPLDRRAVVRSFGSLIDGYATVMRLAATGVCALFDKPLNPFLTEKSHDRNLSTHTRIFTIYRLLADFLPRSPFARVSDQRWNDLRFALEIRNRVVHPQQLEDLDLTNNEMQLVMQTGFDFHQDHQKFVQWFLHKEQQLLWQLPMRRKRFLPKTGRNEKCPCGSERKYKNCCAAAAA